MKRLIPLITLISVIALNVMPAYAYTAKEINSDGIRVYSSGVDIKNVEGESEGYAYLDNRQMYKYMLFSNPFSYIEGVDLLDVESNEKDFIVKATRRALNEYLPNNDYVIANPIEKNGAITYPFIKTDDSSLMDGDNHDYKDDVVVYRKGREEATKVDSEIEGDADFDIEKAEYYYSGTATDEVMFISVESGTKLSMKNFTYGSTTMSSGLYDEKDAPVDTPVLEGEEDLEALRAYFWEDSEIVDYTEYKYGNYLEDHSIYKVPLSVLNEDFRNTQAKTVIDNISDEDIGDTVTIHEGINIVKFTTTAFNDAGYDYYMVVYGKGEEPVVEPETIVETKKDVDTSSLIKTPTTTPTPVVESEPATEEVPEVAEISEPVPESNNEFVPYVICAVLIFVLGGAGFAAVFVFGKKIPKISTGGLSKIKFNGVLDMDNPNVTVKGTVAGLPESDYSVREMIGELNSGKTTVSRMIKKIYMSGVTSYLPGNTKMIVSCSDEPMALYDDKANEDKLFSILMMYETNAKKRNCNFDVCVDFVIDNEAIIQYTFHIRK